jgi:hypothetical protein
MRKSSTAVELSCMLRLMQHAHDPTTCFTSLWQHRLGSLPTVQAHLCLIEAQGSLELRARANLLLADSYLRATAPHHMPSVRVEIEHALTRAVACCDAADWWTRGEEAATLLAMTRRATGDDEGCELAAQKALAFARAMRIADTESIV